MTVAGPVRTLIDETPKGVPEHLTVEQQRDYLRLLSDLTFLRYGLPGPEVSEVSDREVSVDGGTILLRIYRPGPESRLPVHLTLHGGGWKSGSVHELVSDAICRQRCREAHCVIVAVEYRLAPEYPFPVPLDDCRAALAWVLDHAGELGADPANVSIGGASAGGNLAAALALRCRDEGGPALRFQLLEVPALDLTRQTARTTLESGVLPDVPQPTMGDATNAYLTRPADATHPYASPLLAEDLTGLPPAHIMTAEFDVLRTEGEEYARRLRDAGVPVTHERYGGALHGTAMLTRSWEPARAWQSDAARTLRQAHWGVQDCVDTRRPTKWERGG
jgi:acetyl esterase